jgi:hypothetical protein
VVVVVDIGGGCQRRRWVREQGAGMGLAGISTEVQYVRGLISNSPYSFFLMYIS